MRIYALERILYLMERGYSPFAAGSVNLDNGISDGISPSSVSEVMTVNEAAKLLRINLPKMYELVHDTLRISMDVFTALWICVNFLRFSIS